MTKGWVIAALMRLYPPAWRREYGAELTDILLEQPLTPRAMTDVVWSGLWQRGRTAEPSTILGVVSLLIVVVGYGLTGGIYGRDGTTLLRPSSKTFPTVVVTFLASEVCALLLVVCGYWTHLRHGGRVNRSGLAAMKTAFIAGIPILLGALLVMLGLVSLRFPGTTIPHPSPLAILIAPLVRLPESWLWGSLGGLLAKWITRRRRTAAGS